MLLEFAIKNYRSIRDEVVFSMVAEASKSKAENVFTRKLANGDEIRLLKTAVIYGANASGKSNVLRALYELLKFLEIKIPAGKSIPFYDPFLFDTESKEIPTELKLTFLDQKGVKYTYMLAFNDKEVIKEELIHFPNGKKASLLTRVLEENRDKYIHKILIGSESKGKNIEVFSNNPGLIYFGTDYPHEIITEIYVMLSSFKVINSLNYDMVGRFRSEVTNSISSNLGLEKKISELIKFADTKIESISVTEFDENQLHLPENISDSERKSILERFKLQTFALHKVYKEGSSNLVTEITLDEESQGTKTLYCIGGKILETLETGGVLVVDELNTSLHPYLTKLLVMLFQHEKLNPKNAQLVFTTHDTNLLDRTLFRKDQIWFTEKNEFGVTELFSLQDFPDVREDTPFDKWYMAGKFGALPELKSLEALCNDEKE